ncbi:4a-hydroxytetrahydrobiopterin dehydratase [Okibacterium endophyticum]
MTQNKNTLSDDQIAEHLAQLPGWRAEHRGIARRYSLKSARAALDFIAAVGDIAEEMNHHPDLTWSYKAVSVTFTSHDAGGVTSRDLDAARRVSEAADRMEAAAETPRYPQA